MKNSKLNPETIKMINDLKDDIEKMLFMESNIEVIWSMEKLQNDKTFQKSADFIRKSLQ
jgi:hypothetical protein